MKIKKLWELYKELRRLRKKAVVLEAGLTDVNRRYNELLRKYNELNRDYGALVLSKIREMQDGHYDRISIMIPQRCAYEQCAAVPDQKYTHDKISAQMKVKFFDDLFEQGYIKCMQCNDISEVYEIHAIKQRIS